MKKLLGIVLMVGTLFGWVACDKTSYDPKSVKVDKTLSESGELTPIINEKLDKITEISEPTLGGEITDEFEDALSHGRSLLNLFPFSFSLLSLQLEHREYSQDAINWAMEQIDLEINWYAQAVEFAEMLYNPTCCTHQSLFEQLVNAEFTPSQAEYGANALFN